MSKFKVGDKVWCDGKVKTIARVDEWLNGEYGYYFHIDADGLDFYNEEDLELYKTPQERLFELGFEKVAKHKYIKQHKGGLIYEIPYKITIEFAFNMYQVKCECEKWIGVDLKLAEILLDYLEEIRK